jgi:hypothetical protein
MRLDFRVLEKVAFSFVVAFAVILLAFVIHEKCPGLTTQMDDVVLPVGDYPAMCLFSEPVDCSRRLAGTCCV